jgi:hypothetical protein
MHRAFCDTKGYHAKEKQRTKVPCGHASIQRVPWRNAQLHWYGTAQHNTTQTEVTIQLLPDLSVKRCEKNTAVKSLAKLVRLTI